MFYGNYVLFQDGEYVNDYADFDQAQKDYDMRTRNLDMDHEYQLVQIIRAAVHL